MFRRSCSFSGVAARRIPSPRLLQIWHYPCMPTLSAPSLLPVSSPCMWMPMMSASTASFSSGSGGSTVETLESQRNDLEAERKELEAEIDELEAEIDELKEQLKSDISDALKLAIRGNIDTARQEIITIDKRIISLIKRLPPFDPNAPRRFDKDALQTAAQKFRVRDDQGTEREIIGRSGFFEELHGHVSRLLEGPDEVDSSQYSRAFVLDGASGIGKTFGSLAFGPQFPSTINDRNYDIFTTYVGFNCSAALSSFEKHRIDRAADTKDDFEIEKCLRHVLFTRLWLHLAFDWEGNGGAATQFASKTLVMEPGFTYDISEKDMASFIVEQAPRLRELSATSSADGSTSERPLVLMVVVDEGQELDDLCPAAPNDKFTSGARTSLRVLRQLQMSLWGLAYNPRVLLLPLMTGLNPNTVVLGGERGQNTVLGLRRTSAMMDFAAYHDIVRGLKYTGKLQLSAEHRRRVASLLYPRVRGIVDGRRDLQDVCVPESIVSLDLPPADVDMLIPATLTREYQRYMLVYRVPVDVIKRPGPEETRYVYIDAVTWRRFASILRIQLPFKFERAAVELVCRADESSSTTDQSLEFNVFTFVFQLLLHPALVNTRKELSARCSDWLPEGFASLSQPATSPSYTMERLLHAIKLGSPTTSFHPFTNKGSHKKAFEEAELSEDFACALEDSSYLEEPLFVLCGAEAPFDFLLLYRPTPTTQPKRVRLWMCDAKHVTDTKKALPVAQPAKIQEMEETAEKLHNALKRALKATKKDLELDDEFQWHIVSNSTNIDSDGSRHRVINPDNFVLEPWRSVLFGTTPRFFDRDTK